MDALKKQSVPIPEMVGLCEDSSVIGTPFYIMNYVSGKIYKDPSLPGVDSETRSKIYRAMNKTIAKIHSVDVQKAGLSDYGKVYSTTVWKLHIFSVTQILREIKFGEFGGAKSANLAHLHRGSEF